MLRGRRGRSGGSGRTARRGTPADLLVVGLGNPGPEYQGTRHNVGAETVELLAARHGAALRGGRYNALVDEVQVGQKRLALAVPLTYMNESGNAVSPLVRRFGVEDDPGRLLVVHDELDLPPGTLRVKVGGGLAGNNGLRSITQHLHTQDYARIRIGVGKPASKERGADHVLRRPSKAERAELDVVVQEAADAVELYLAEGAEAAMTRFNREGLRGPIFMTTVFVHGVPETAAIWDRLRGELDRDSVTLALPGFGVPRPDGFGATQDEYVGWLVGELEAIGGPIDLVGHDWGGILTARIVTTHATPLHSWVSDAVGAVSPTFVWHDLAKVWQTPGDGEAFFAGLLADPAEAAGLLAAVGVPEADAAAMADALDQRMVDAILALYRSSTHLGRDWGHEGPGMDNGLVLVGGADPLGDVAGAERMAGTLGAEFAALDGGGHWWPLDSATAGARALEAFWAGLD